MFQAEVVVVDVVGGCDFECTCSKFTVNIFVDDDGDGAVDEGYQGLFSVKSRKALIFGMHADGGVAQNGFGSCSSDGDEVFCAFNLVADIIQFRLYFLVKHFFVRNRG